MTCVSCPPQKRRPEFSRPRWPRVLAVLCSAGLSLACGDSDPADASNSSGGQPVAMATGGMATGGQIGSGGASSSGGATETGGEATGGEVGAGTGAAPAAGGCRENDECAEGTTCYLPGVEPPETCDEPDYCGECTCPPMPVVPIAIAQECDAATPCPGGMMGMMAGAMRAASTCGDAGICEECASDQDCPPELSHCAVSALFDARMCFECASDSDCPGERPLCDLTTAGSVQEAGTCVECAEDTDCAEGACTDGVCAPECSSDADCAGTDLLICGSAARCEEPPCTTDTDCPSVGTCTDRGCVRKSCSADDDCGAAEFCVGFRCYPSLGSCLSSSSP